MYSSREAEEEYKGSKCSLKGCLPAGKPRAEVLAVTAPVGRVRVEKRPTVVSGLQRILIHI